MILNSRYANVWGCYIVVSNHSGARKKTGKQVFRHFSLACATNCLRRIVRALGKIEVTSFFSRLCHDLRQRMLYFASENKIIKVKQKMVAFLMLSATTTSKGLPRACSDARAGFLRENKLSKNI